MQLQDLGHMEPVRAVQGLSHSKHWLWTSVVISCFLTKLNNQGQNDTGSSSFYLVKKHATTT